MIPGPAPAFRFVVICPNLKNATLSPAPPPDKRPTLTAFGPVRDDLLMTDPGPEVEDRHPADVVTAMVELAGSAFYADSVGGLAP
jgi:hypothetical protein